MSNAFPSRDKTERASPKFKQISYEPIIRQTTAVDPHYFEISG